ncbi:MAG TPA: LysR family transcriptional regulator [Acidocella sp.]|uniref:LysR family transcriptional regulator n=1 Tax=Acidocella sp. TaxID=50710 RepID=UPI002C3EF479|nr:LysR family transcriptional regulator [Acidocella sp.]HVE20784.1 LysR family transcriptional regulator [Acidocella sp.]
MSFDARILTGVGVLAAVTEAGNFARAAETLGLTPSGVSRAIARLEARVGVRLFDRTPRSVTLTEEGRRFHARVMPLLAGIDEAATEIAGAAAAVSGKLRLNIDPWFARIVLAPNLPRFLERHPLLSLDMIVSNHREEMMGGMDLAVRFGPMEGASLIARKLLETRVSTYAAPAYLKRNGVPGTPHELLHHETILFRDPQTGRPFTWGFSRDGETFDVDVRGRFTTDDPTTAIEACIAGQGIFQGLELGIGRWIERGELVQILADWSDETYPLYAYRASRHLPPAKVRAFLDFVQEIAR